MMDFIDKVREIAVSAPNVAEHIQGNEEATKNALIMPFINALGYNVFNPSEVIPEFTADVGTKKGEKVDYAIMENGKPIMLFECKAYGTNLSDVHASQLYRYFSATEARFGILTNGIIYRFYADLDAPNKMDEKPFLVFNLLSFQEALVNELKRFTKSAFDVDEIISTAAELKYTREIRRIVAEQFSNPDEYFVRFFASQVYSGRMTQTVIEQFRAITKQALKLFINDQINSRLKSALAEETPPQREEQAEEQTPEGKKDHGIVTTAEELDGYFVVKSILRENVDVKRVTIRDTKSYCGILLDDNNRRTICRLRFNRTQKYIGIFDEHKNEQRYPIDDVDDIYQYADQLKATIDHYVGTPG